MKGKELLTLAVALVLALALTGCAPKDAGVAILTGLDKKELAQGDLPCRSYYEGETLMVPLCEVARALGYSAEWDSANQTAIIDDEYIQKATLTAGSKTTLFEGHLQVINMSREVELAQKRAQQQAGGFGGAGGDPLCAGGVFHGIPERGGIRRGNCDHCPQCGRPG